MLHHNPKERPPTKYTSHEITRIMNNLAYRIFNISLAIVL